MRLDNYDDDADADDHYTSLLPECFVLTKLNDDYKRFVSWWCRKLKVLLVFVVKFYYTHFFCSLNSFVVSFLVRDHFAALGNETLCWVLAGVRSVI